MGLAFPFFLVALKLTTPAGVAAWSTRGGCRAAGIPAAGINYLLASREPGNRDGVDLVLVVGEPDRAMLAAARRVARPGAVHNAHVRRVHPRPDPVRTGARARPHGTRRHEAAGVHREIEYRALHDFLTGLPNRVLLADRCSTALREDIPRSRSRTSRSARMAASAVVHSEGHGRDVNTLLRRADIAMYVAKARSVGTFA